MLQLGAKNYNWTMTREEEGGHQDIVERMLQLGAKNYNWTMTREEEGGHRDIVELIKRWQVTP